jgi:type 1 glutamine amidotransferase/sugar phosphate isomerase/epimerase
MLRAALAIGGTLLAATGWSQEFSPAALEKAGGAIGWRFGSGAPEAGQTLMESARAAARLGLRHIEGDSLARAGAGLDKALDHRLTDNEIALVVKGLQEAGVMMPVYRVRRLPAASELPQLFEFARKLGVETIVAEPDPGVLPELEKWCDRYGINLAIAGWDPKKVAAATDGRSSRLGAAGDVGAWMRAGIRPLEALDTLRERLITVRLDDCDGLGPNCRAARLGEGVADLQSFLQEAYRLQITPTLWSFDVETGGMASILFLHRAIGPIAQYHRSYAGRTRGVRRMPTVNEEERRRIEQALPARAPAQPKKPRKLLVIDLNVGSIGGHPSIPYANLAVELMGKRTGAFTATFSNDPGLFTLERLREFDAVFLNNAQGNVFETPESREAFSAYIRGGGGLVANHSVTVLSTDWDEFGEILGARGAAHRVSDERVTVRLEEPQNPLNAAFGGKSFEFADEFFRFRSPYSRAKVRVLQTIDVAETDMNQGRCTSQCERADEDYAVSWIRSYGKGRVFYTTLGHGPAVFWDARMLEMFLAAIQFACGDLAVDASPDLDAAARIFEGLLARIEKDESPQDDGAHTEAVRVVRESLAMPAWRARVERSLLDMLQRPGSSLAAKDFACRQLAVVGGASSAHALAGC